MYNPGHEDQIRPGNFLISEPNLYLVESFLGNGSFGIVAKCTRVNDTATVAIKLVKSSHLMEALLEVGNKKVLLVKVCACKHSNTRLQ